MSSSRVGHLLRLVAKRVPILHVIFLTRHGIGPLGWIESARRGEPVDADGNAIPWFSYPAVRFLETRVAADMRVFEYGAGNSTLWWAAKVRHVTACEHDALWAGRLTPLLPPNVDLHERGIDDGYVESIRGRGPFEIIVVDGRERVRCAREAVNELADDGVIIWDNVERERYREGREFLEECGFRRIDFTGLAALGEREVVTAVYYRPRNCLGI